MSLQLIRKDQIGYWGRLYFGCNTLQYDDGELYPLAGFTGTFTVYDNGGTELYTTAVVIDTDVSSIYWELPDDGWAGSDIAEPSTTVHHRYEIVLTDSSGDIVMTFQRGVFSVVPTHG